MCVLLIAWRVSDDLPLVVAANRDEALARAATPPSPLPTAAGTALAPRDLLAGGTWEGIADSGLVVVITNRRDGDFHPARPSRGAVCRGALDQPSAAAVRAWIDTETRQRRYNSFNLFYADRDHAFVSSWNGALVTRELEPGKLALSNEHGPGELQVPRFEQLDLSRARAELRRELIAILGDHAPLAGGFRVCKHGTAHGTVSSSLFLLDRAGEFTFEYAAGPPCRKPFLGFELERSGRAAPGRNL